MFKKKTKTIKSKVIYRDTNGVWRVGGSKRRFITKAKAKAFRGSQK